MTALAPFFGVGAMTGTQTEIQLIEHDLQILRERYALFKKCARIMKLYCAVTIPLIAVLLVVVILRAFPEDMTVALFLIGVLTLIVAILVWIRLRWPPPKEGPRHWLDSWRMIDLISPQPYPSGDFFPWYRRNTGPFSEAQEIEYMITVREQRLAEIRGSRP
jgi:hypothetical protein